MTVRELLGESVPREKGVAHLRYQYFSPEASMDAEVEEISKENLYDPDGKRIIGVKCRYLVKGFPISFTIKWIKEWDPASYEGDRHPYIVNYYGEYMVNEDGKTWEKEQTSKALLFKDGWYNHQSLGNPNVPKGVIVLGSLVRMAGDEITTWYVSGFAIWKVDMAQDARAEEATGREVERYQRYTVTEMTVETT